MYMLLLKFIERGIDWIFRPLFIGAQLLKYGTIILVATLGADFVFGADYASTGRTLNVRLSTGSGLPAFAVITAYVIAVILILTGLALVVRQALLDIKKERRQLLIVVELKGLSHSPETPAKDYIMRNFLGQRQNILLDFRPQRTDDLVDPVLMLERVDSMMPTIRTLAAGRDTSDVFVAVGGLAAVPALFLTGALLEDESKITTFDWDRGLKKWREIDGQDDGKRALPFAMPTLAHGCQEAVLTVPCSYKIEDEDVAKAFPGIPVARLDAEEILADRFWSEQKQIAFVQQFRDAIQRLQNSNVRTVHVVLAAPSSLCIRMGMCYDRRLHPEVIVYQYERSVQPAYPWGIAIPSATQPKATIVWP